MLAQTCDLHDSSIMACRFGWSANTGSETSPPQSIPVQAPLTSSNESRSKRFIPCRGRLYHQLTCSHRIRTDVVEDCGSNCLDPISNALESPFYCHECVEKQAAEIWNERQTQHNSLYPPMGHMTTEQYEQWYTEHRELEAQFSKDRKIYELDLKAGARPSNICSAAEATKEEAAIAAELDSMSLAMVSSHDSVVSLPRAHPNRRSLPNDASEQLHWGLNTLAIDRGSCGIEYASPPVTNQPQIMLDEEELWRKPRSR